MNNIKMKTITALILGLYINPALLFAESKEMADTTLIQIGFNNFVSGEHSQAIGNNNITTSINGSSLGTDNIATGNNLDKIKFDDIKRNVDKLVQDRKNISNDFDNINARKEANKKAQSDLNDFIRKLNSLNNVTVDIITREKLLNDLKNKKLNELTGLQEALANTRNNIVPVTVDRTIWTDFSGQLAKLEWNKLTQPNGVDSLATDLKTSVEADLPELTKYDIGEYKAIINGYINKQGVYGINKD